MPLAFAVAKRFSSMIAHGAAMVVRVKHNVVGYYPIPDEKKHGRGRTKKYGKKLKIWNLFEMRYSDFIEIQRPIRDEGDLKLRAHPLKVWVRQSLSRADLAILLF